MALVKWVNAVAYDGRPDADNFAEKSFDALSIPPSLVRRTGRRPMGPS